MNKLVPIILLGVLTLSGIQASVSADQVSTLGGYIMSFRGGFGAVALIDSYYAGGCFEDEPVHYMITVIGDNVILAGTNSGTAPGQSRTYVRTHLAFGFGAVTLYCTVHHNGKLIEEKTLDAMMIGFFIIT